MRPETPTAAGALGEGGTCHKVDAYGEPLIVDWKPEQRGDLEVAMKEGVAVVAYSCEGIKLLKDCHIDGQYGFMGMTRREQVVRLKNADEVRANLPLSGASLGGAVQRGSTLDIAMVMVGKTRTTWDHPTRDDLKGTCDGATHFVRGAIVGAFVMDRGTEAKVRAAAEILGMGAGADSSSAAQFRNQDGDPSDCKNASPDSAKAPAQCGAPIRLVLTAIEAAPGADRPATAEAPAADAPAVAAVDEPCPEGLVFADGKCTSPASAPAYQCAAGKAEECTAQCDKGHAGSCATLGAMLASGDGVSRDEAKAARVLKKACDGGESKGCVGLGVLLTDGRGVAANPTDAAPLFEKACHDGEALGCGLLGNAYAKGTGVSKDTAKALVLFQQACEGGHARSCFEAGRLLLTGEGATADPPKAAELLKRACDGGQGDACNALGELHEVGKQARRDPIVASMMYRRGCIMAAGDACTNLGRMQLAGAPGAGESAQEAQRSFERGCMLRSELSCAVLKGVFGAQTVYIPNVMRAQELRRSCDSGDARACGLTGVLNLAQGIKPMAMNDLQRACTMTDQFACAVQKRIK